MGPAKVIEAAHKAGIQYIASPTKIGARIDLSKTDESGLKDFGNEIGYGQYAITALDHANGVATLANDGVYNKAHFVKSVKIRDDKTGKFKPFKNEQLKPKEAFSTDVVAAIDHILQKIPSKNGRALSGGRDAIGKTGTWEYKDGKTGENGDAWMVGATRKIAASVWIGREQENKKTKQMQLLPIKKPGGGNMTGGSTPGEIWKKFMDAASEAINAPNANFLPDAKVGNPEMKGNGKDPLPPPPDQNNGCVLGGLICPPGQNNGGNNGGGNNGGQTPQPGEPTLPTTLPGFPEGGGGGQDGTND